MKKFDRSFPKRMNLGNFPTRIERNRFLSDYIGTTIYIKNEFEADAIGSGNKVRKLEYLIPYLLENNYKALIIDGIVQSNSCMSISYYASLFGLEIDIISIGSPEYFGNHASMILSGANIHYLKKWSQNEINATANQILDFNNSLSKKTFIVPTGISNELTLLGSIDMVREISMQESSLKVNFDYIVLPVGTGGTINGLVAGSIIKEKNWKVVGIAIANNKKIFQEIFERDIAKASSKYGLNEKIVDARLDIFERALGRGYGLFSAKDVRQVKNLAMHGIFVDTIYMNKTVLGLKQLVKERNINENENVLLIHTGGINQRLYPPYNL